MSISTSLAQGIHKSLFACRNAVAISTFIFFRGTFCLMERNAKAYSFDKLCSALTYVHKFIVHKQRQNVCCTLSYDYRKQKVS